MDNIIGAVGAVLLGIVGFFVVRKRSQSNDHPGPRPTVPTDLAERVDALRKADDAKRRAELEEINNRPHTDDAVADLESRLGYGRPHRGSAGESSAPSDSSD